MNPSNPLAEEIHEKIMQETRRRLFDESYPRVKKCLSMLTDEEVWYRPNNSSNSIGNLVLHLCGNVRQYIISGIGGQPDSRQRQQEFNEKGPLPIEKLVGMLDEVMKEVSVVLDQVKPKTLVEERRVQGFEENVTSILIHVVEHFSYHTGQITYFVKAHKNTDMGYYAGLNLDQTS